MHSRSSFLGLAVGLLLSAPALGQVVHHAAADFSITNGNPNGVWSYGSLPASPGTTFTAFAETATGDLNVWRPVGATTLLPSVARNETGAVFNSEVSNGTISGDTLGVVRLQAGELMLNPGLTGIRVAVRFTAPQTAVYRFQGAFTNVAEENGAEVITRLHKGAVELYSRTWNQSGSGVRPTGEVTAQPFDLSVAMTAGETVDVSVAQGSSVGRDSVGLSLTATQLHSGSATDQRWIGGTGDWSTAAEWNFGVVPNNNPPLLFNATLDILNPVSNVNLNIPVEIEKLTLGIKGSGTNGIFVSGSGSLTIHDTFNWNHATLSSSGGITFGPESTVNVAASGGTNSFSSNILNQGTMTVSPAIINGVPLGEASSTRLQIAKTNSTAVAPVFTNDVNATFTLHGVADLLASGDGGGPIINNGTFIKSGTAGEDSRIDNFHTFTNNGLIQVDGGSLTLPNGTHSGDCAYQLAAGTELRLNGTQNFAVATEVNGTGTLAVTGGTTTANAPLTFNSGARINAQFVANADVDFHGPLTLDLFRNGFSGPSDIRVHGQFDWLQGKLFGDGTTTIASGAVINLLDSGERYIEARTLVNDGTMNLSSSRLDLRDNAVLNNAGTMHFSGQADYAMFTNGEGNANTINNSGLIRKTGAGTTTHININVFNNTGTVRVESGTLRLSAAGTHTEAVIEIDADAILQLAGPNVFDSATTITGPGKLLVSLFTTHVLTFNGTQIDAPVEFISGYIEGENCEFRSDIVWTGGRMNGPGTTTLAAGSHCTIADGNAQLLDLGRILRNLGTFTMNDSFGLAGSSRLENEGQLTANGDADFANGSGTIVNLGTGTFIKDGLPGQTTTMSGIAFENSGVVEARGGTLSFSSTYTQTAGSLVLKGGEILKSSGTVTINGGSVLGGGTITGAVAVGGGTIAPGIGGTTGILAITGDLSLSSSSKLSFDIGGTTPGTEHDRITEAGSTALNLNNCTLELGHLDGYAAGTVTILSSNAAITGAFANAPRGQRLRTKDGKGIFRVSYPVGSFSVQLESFVPAPYDLALAGSEVAENLPQGTLVGILSAQHLLPTPDLEFTLVAGAGSTDNASFRIFGNQLEVQAPLDFENGGASRSIRVRVTNRDNGEFIENVFPVTVIDVPSPASLALSNLTVVENLPAGTIVGQLSALPAEQAPFTFALASGTGSADNALFSVDGSTLKLAAPLDFEAQPSRSIRVRVTNAGGETLDQVFAVQVEDVPAPVDLALTGSSVAENLPAGTAVGTLSAMDVTDLTFILVSGAGADHNALFQISGNELKTAAPLDFESVPSPSVRVRVTNEGGETLEQAFSITVIDQGITALSMAPQSVKENLPAGTVVGSFSATVVPAGTAVTYALVSGTGSVDNALFSVDGAALKTAAVLDEEASATRSVRVRGTDANGETFDQQFTVSIEDNDPNITVTSYNGATLPASESPVDLGLGLLSPEVLRRTFSIQNTGVAQLQNLSASLTGGDAALFTLVPASLPATLSPGASSPLTLNYSPPDEGIHTTTLRLLSNDPDSPTFDIPLTAQGVTQVQVAQMAYVKDTEPSAGGLFGSSVAVDGNTVVIGTNTTQGLNPRAVTVLSLDPLTDAWNSQRVEVDSAVSAVAVSADTLAVGQRLGNAGKGRVSVYVRSGAAWSLQQQIDAPASADQGDNFGFCVALDGDRLIVGALFEDSSATGINSSQSDNSSADSGAAYIYQRTGLTWALDAFLKASDTESRALFGSSVSISGTTAAVGAPKAGADDSGAVYVYTRNAGGWSQQAHLKAASAAQDDNFGHAVGISGDAVVVGAPSEDGKSRGVGGNPAVKGVLNSGAAYVFVRSGAEWAHQAYLKASNSDPSDGFGSSVTISGDTVAVGSFNEDSLAIGVNAQQNDNNAGNSGAAYLFQRRSGLWVQHSYLKASNTGAGDQFGSAIAVSGNRLVIGAPFEDGANPGINGDGSNNDLSNSGSAYILDIIPPEVIVHNGPDTSSPRLADLQEETVSFGATPLTIPVTRAFTIVNSSGRPLNVTGIQVPAFQFTVVDMPSSPIAPFATATFFVRATAALSGLHEGTVAISTNHSDPLFEFTISVDVVAGVPGTLDPDFGSQGTGVATISSGSFSSDRAFAMALQPDGRIVVAGVSGTDSILVSRLTADGRPDPTFNGGRPATRFLETEAEGFGGMAVAVHEGKIVVAASSGWQGFGGGAQANGSQRHAVLRFNGNGTLDTSFGTDGIFFGDAAASAVEAVRGVKATASGKLIVVGRAGDAAFVSRINQDGTLDTSFGDQGYVRLRSGLFGVPGWNTSTTADSVLILADQSIVVGGSESRREVSTGNTFNFASLWKLAGNGQVLGNESRERTAIDPFFSSGSFCSISDLTLTPDGRIAAAGRVSAQSLPLSDTGRGVFHARFDTNLIPDTSYQSSPSTGYLPAGSSQNSFHAMGIAVQPNLKPLIVGYEGAGSPSPSQATFVRRYLPSGSVDLSYGQSGRAILNMPNSRAYAAVMTANGDLLVAGHTLEPKIFVLRLHGDEKVPEIAVRNGSRLSDPEITDDQAEGISFGSPRIGLAVQKTFLVQNLGTAPLDLDAITVPASFHIVSRPGSVLPGSSQPLVIEFVNDLVGNYGGAVSITTNDTDEGQFTFPVFGTVQVNSPPVFRGFVAKTVQGEKVLISLGKILSRVTDANADIVQVTGFSAVSAFGGTITEELEDVLVYVPHPAFSGQDQFSITFSDGESEIVGVVSVDVEPDPAFNPKNPPKLEVKTGGNLEVQFTGIPKREYIIERSINLVDWDPVGGVTADDLGRVVFSDPSPPQPSAFYRITF